MTTTTNTTSPAITFDTCEEYEAQCERCTEAGIAEAADRIWEVVKADMDKTWKLEEQYRGFRCSEARKQAKRVNIQARRRLDTYASVLLPLGYKLSYFADKSDECHHIFDVKVTSDNRVVGSLRCYLKDSWL